jgi:uridine phosphorylase
VSPQGNWENIHCLQIDSDSPILNHPVHESSAFTARSLMDDVRRARQIPAGSVPPVCFLDFDGDLTDWLVREGIATPYDSWACFHTTMFALQLDGMRCGLIARTIGAPYAVLIAEQLYAAGARLIVGLTSAGRVSPDLPLPCLLVVTGAIRDEGTSYHYLPPSREVSCPTPIAPLFAEHLRATGWAVRSGKVWTTDAPYRETETQLQNWASEGALAVEMQAAALFAFGTASGAGVATVAVVSNAVDHPGKQFDTGPQEDGLKILESLARAARSFLDSDSKLSPR